jgi:hypothetical protein
MRTITKTRAQELASHWHDGQWSALYSFASTGQFFEAQTLQYFKEIYGSIESEYYLRPITRSQKQLRELHSLERYLLKEANERKLIVEFHQHDVYGYTIPYIADSVPDELANKVNQVSYLK